ncbi:MAG: FHA domain-containing protein [Myxococcaceae bacterium]|nr:FHA domain-containing protein [Myxococcaceae bacterium]
MFTISVTLSGTRITTKGTLSNREVFVGRSKKCQLMLRDETVSGIHCRLIAIEGGTLVMDEGSTNGTWVNGELVTQPVMVTMDDELRIGPYVLMVHSLVGGANSGCPRVRIGRRVEQQLAAAGPLAPRPLVKEPPTNFRVSQVQVVWRLLGFRQPATLEEARAAFLQLIQDYRPETMARLSPELQLLAEQRLRELEFAWQYLQRLFKKNRDAA